MRIGLDRNLQYGRMQTKLVQNKFGPTKFTFSINSFFLFFQLYLFLDSPRIGSKVNGDVNEDAGGNDNENATKQWV